MERRDVAKRTMALGEKFDQQPYAVEIDGFKLKVDKGVFPPDFGLTTRYLAQFLKNFKFKKALDMGCGSGYLALVLKKSNKDSEVWAVDTEESAIKCAEQNANLNKLSVKIIKSDLFSQIKKDNKFDLIVFNQPYYPLQNHIFGCKEDGGKEIISRFLEESKKYLFYGGTIIMPYSDVSGEINNPLSIAKQMGYDIETKIIKRNDDGTHYIYEIKYGTAETI